MKLYREGAKTCSAKCRKRVSRASKAVQIPAEMVNSERWMRWKKVNRNGKTTKRPITVDGLSGSSTDSSTWSSHAEASNATIGDGLGFALGQGVGCIDLDHCISDGVVADWARTIIDQCPPTFIEVSQSGTGIHIFGLLHEGAGRNIRRNGTAVEFYSTGRYIAVTGNKFEGSPSVLGDLSEVVASIV